jgi:hypothetical protein
MRHFVFVVALVGAGCATSNQAVKPDGHWKRAQKKPLPRACLDTCVTPYGSVLGRSHGGVIAYSNCSARCVSRTPNHVQGRYIGMRWQCVEYARRWLRKRRGVVYGDVDVAADIWKHETVERVRDGQKLPLLRFENGSKTVPRTGDLLIYARSYLGTGHVAVVVGVDAKKKLLNVAEQNFENKRWPGRWARTLSWTSEPNGGVRFREPHLLGWMRVSPSTK